MSSELLLVLLVLLQEVEEEKEEAALPLPFIGGWALTLWVHLYR